MGLVGVYNSPPKSARKLPTLQLIHVAVFTKLGQTTDLEISAYKVERGSSIYRKPASESCGFQGGALYFRRLIPSSSFTLSHSHEHYFCGNRRR